jgi:hypothetical protein
MDLNYLLSRHQLSLMSATAAPSVEARWVHRVLAEHYATRIADLRLTLGCTTQLLDQA